MSDERESGPRICCAIKIRGDLFIPVNNVNTPPRREGAVFRAANRCSRQGASASRRLSDGGGGVQTRTQPGRLKVTDANSLARRGGELDIQNGGLMVATALRRNHFICPR